MPTSTRFVVAVHALTALAVSDGKPMRSEDLAYSANTSPVVIRGLLSRLSEVGLTRSQLGAGGGTMLARPAKKIKLLDVYEAVEPSALFAMHRATPNQECPVGFGIRPAMQSIYAGIEDTLRGELAHTTLADVLRDVLAAR